MDVDENEGGGSGSGSARGPAEVPSGTEGAEEEEQSNTSSDDQKKGKQRAKWGNEQHKLEMSSNCRLHPGTVTSYSCL